MTDLAVKHSFNDLPKVWIFQGIFAPIVKNSNN